jgi:hypothetical protein
MKRFAEIIIEKRLFFLIGIILITLFFLYQAVFKLEIKTIYNDLLPKNHEYVNLHNEIRNKFGGANQVLIMLQMRDKEDGGKYDNVFNFETLETVKNISEDLLDFHAVDRNKIFSLYSRRVREIKVTASGMEFPYMMFPNLPKTQEELDSLRLKIFASPICYPLLVDFSTKKTLIMVDFFEEQIDYKTAYKEFKELRKKYENDNIIVAIAGEPMHLGYVDSYIKDILKILALTIVAMLIMFYIYFRSKRGMLLPIIAAGVSAIWGLGFLSLLGFNLDPLVLVFPFLISAMAASHTVQVVKRYKEEAHLLGDNTKACKAVIEHLFVPGFAGIITDASGIIIIALVPIPILQKICLSCSFWAFATVIIAMIMIPIMLSYMPLKSAKEGTGILDRTLKSTGRWVCSWGKYPVLGISLIMLVWGSFYANDIQIGSALPGSEVLWPWHRYNVDSFRITFGMPLLNPLLVIIQGEEAQSIGLNSAIMRDVVEFSRYLQRTPGMRVMFVLSCLGQIPGRNRGMRDNDPNQEFMPTVDRELKMLYKHIVFSSPPGTMDKFIDNDEKTINIIVYCRDKTTETIQIVMDRIHDYIRNKSPFGKRSTDVKREGFDKFVYWIDGFFREQREPIPEKPPVEGMPVVHYRLAGGAVGVQAGINEALQLYQIWTFILAILTVLILCAIIFKSFFAGVIITAPLIVANVLAFTFLAFSKPYLALTTATLPVSAVGIGLGVDYGIYLVSRIIEEYDIHGNLDEAISIALGTTGKAIVYVATTLVCGIVFWFLSKMMFQAMMGLLLAIILLLNMLGALLIIPAAISLVKPKFIVGRKK